MRYLGLVLGMLFLCGAAFSQEVTAGIYGSVQDASNAVVPQATVTLRSLETGRTLQTKSDESGNYVLTLVPIGTYEITVEANGFRTSRVSNVVLRVNDNRRFNVTLEVGAVSEQVTVAAEAVAVNTASGATSAVLEGKEMVKIPRRGVMSSRSPC
ncbi:MAG: carboxypeptidase regulatory-like domain-containing protein [Bryobacterales bacterium]|nr:carboxypeptidase regulatory-like domain-containing protein [Bryobacterales bacterium]